MASALLVPELQLEVFRNLSKEDLPGIARVCQAWNEAALDVLWGERRIWTDAILRLFPDDTQIGQEYE